MKGIVGFVAGAAIGSAITFVATRLSLKSKYQKKYDADILAIKDTNQLMAERKAKKQEGENKGETEKSDEKEDENSDAPFKKGGFIKPKVEIEDYGGEDDDIGEFENDMTDRNYYSQLQDILKKEGKPYNITCEEFEDNTGFDKVDVTYDQSREEYIDERTGEPLEDGAIVLGWEAGCLDDDRAWPDDGLYYIRNERISTDFCVTKVAVI